MSEATRTRSKRAWEHFRATWPLYAAALVTIGFGYWTYCLAFEALVEADSKPVTRWDQFRAGQPNTMGDTLAGFVGSLTLIWVVASVIQQSMELKAQRREFEAMADAMGQQVRAMQAQAMLLETQRQGVEEERANAEFEECLKSLAAIVQDFGFRHWEHQTEGLVHDAATKTDSVQLVWERISVFHVDTKETDRAVASMAISLRRFINLLNGSKLRALDKKKSAGKKMMEQALSIVNACLSLEAKLNQAGRARIVRLQIQEIRSMIEDLLTRDLWDTSGHDSEVLPK